MDRSFNMSYFIIVFLIGKSIQENLVINTSRVCNTTNTCQQGQEECTKGYCHCKFPYHLQPEVSVTNCVIKNDMVTLMEIKQGEHVDVIDFLQMKGLHCGNESTGYFRKANYDELPAACFKYVHVNFHNTITVNLNRTIMDNIEQCEATYFSSNIDGNCFIRKNGFQLAFSTGSHFIIGVYTETSGGLKILETKTSKMLTFKNASELANSNDVQSVESMTIKLFKHKHPDCMPASPKVTMKNCPSDLKRPLVQVNHSPTDINLHDSATLHCRILSMMNVTHLDWLYNTTMIFDEMVGYEISTNMEEKVSTLKITMVTPDRIGPYYCNASNNYGRKASSILLNLKEGVPNPSVSEDLKVVNIGNDEILSCTVPEAYPSIVTMWWEKDNITLPDMNKYSINKKNGLNIHKVTPGDLGEYRCCANNTKGTNCSEHIKLKGPWKCYNLSQADIEEGTNTDQKKVCERNGRVFTSGANANFLGCKTCLCCEPTVPLCRCSCAFKAKLDYWRQRNISKEKLLQEMQPLLNEVLNNIKMDKSKISVVLRKLTSAPDDRKSAEQIGILGIVLIVAAVAVIIIFDIISCIKFCSRRNRVKNDL